MFTKKILLIFLMLSMILGASLWYCLSKMDGIYEYTAEKDRDFIINLIASDREWLTASSDFSAEYMLDNKASSTLPTHKGDLTIKVYRVCDKPVGFVSYYKKKFYEGYVLMLAVDKKERGKGYARELLTYAVNALKNQGASVVGLLTRVANTSAQKVYRGLGFEEILEDGYFMRFKKYVT